MQKERLQFATELVHDLAIIMTDFKIKLVKFIEEHNDDYEYFPQDVFHVVLSDIFLLMMESAPNYSSLKTLIEVSWNASLHCAENLDEEE